MKEILLHWAKTDAVFIPSGVKDENWGNYVYEAVQSWSSFGSYYATFYDEFNYSDTERKIVDAYIKDKLLNLDTRNLTTSSHGTTCDPDNLKRTVGGQLRDGSWGKIDHNSCGSSVWKTTLAQLLVGLRLNDKALFKKGVENTKYQLSFFDDTGIFTTWAIKGANAYKYSSHVPVMLGGLTEIYASVGYDFMEHKLRNGLSVKQLMDRQYEILLDPHILDSYVKRYPLDYRGVPNSVYLQSSAEQIRNDAGLNLFAFVRNLPRYIDTYRADIGNSQEFDKKLASQPQEVWSEVPWMSLGTFKPLDPYLVYISDIKEPESKIKVASELSIFEIEGETFSLNLDKVDFVETGSFELERAEEGYLKPFQLHKAHIEGILRLSSSNKQFDFRTLVFKQADTQEQKLVIHIDNRTIKPLEQHKDSLEKKCGSKVMEWGWLSFISETNYIKSARNQQCIYDYFREANDSEALELFQAVLGGTDSILDYLETSDMKEPESKIKVASELSIFEIDGETFNLALDKVDFSETGPFELEREEEGYLMPFQLHKGHINGYLNTKSNGIKKFRTLVYKYADTEEQKLVIHVDNSTIKPLKRHKDSLEKKCGSKVMEWGWLSFISETNDIKSARNQQCIYDYFKEANDREAWELFQAVLGGTDSILDYLETNVVATKEEEKRIPTDLELPIFDDVEYKLAGQILKINIGDPKMKPLMRHFGALLMKCGSGLIDTKSGWISFVSSDSNDIRNSRNQQCHYDYFQKSNDKQAFELFKAVLSGTDSILDYLQK
jgi:hypothetical protein